jgi:excisionase family DNA binding protein
MPTSEVATFLGCSPAHVGILIRTKQLPAVKVGIRYRVDPRDLDKFVKRNRTTDL